jgi:hypothetical protein
MRVEVLTFEGCPNAELTLALVREVASEVGVDPDLVVVDVPDIEAAERLGFLGSPTVRVDGRDVEPGADERDQAVYACRVYRSASGLSGLPGRDWIVAALRAASR